VEFSTHSMEDKQICPNCEEYPIDLKDEKLCNECLTMNYNDEQEMFDIYGGDPLDETTWFGNEPDRITWADIAKQEE